MKRTLRVLVTAGTLLLVSALPASAHVLQVTHPHSGEVVSTHGGAAWEELKEEGDVGWVGGMRSFAAHGGGLISACGATTDNGNDVVFIGTTWNDLNHCTHFGP